MRIQILILGFKRRNSIHLLETWRELEPECVSQVFLGSLLRTRRSTGQKGSYGGDGDDDGRQNVPEKVNSRPFNLHRDYFQSLTLSDVGEPSESWIPKNPIQIQKERGNFVVACVLPLYNVKLGIFTSWSRSDGKEMYKKTWCTWKMVVLVVKPVVFVTFSLWSPSSDLEVPNRDLTTATATATATGRSNTIRFISKITTLQDVKL